MSLLMHLPHYVAADRPLDAWIIQHCALLTADECDESNAFLFQMFSFGYDGWVAEQRGRDAALLGQMGIDISRLEGMNMEEMDAWVQEQQADPAKRAQMEELLLANPEQRAQAEANLQQLERDASKLLERDDATHLFLAPEEVQPWLPRLTEIWAGLCGQFPDAASPSPSPAAGKALMDAMFPLLGEMVSRGLYPGAHSTPDRPTQVLPE